MGTYSKHQAYPDRSIRIPAYVITLGLMIASAVFVIWVLAQIVPWFLSLQHYVPASLR